MIELYSQIAGAYFTGFAVLLGVKVHGLSVLQAAMLVTVQGAAFVLTLLLAGRFTLGLKRQRRIALGFAGMLAALVCLALPWTGPLWAGSLLLGVSTGWLHLVSVECFAQVAADIGKGRTGGLFNMAGAIGRRAGLHDRRLGRLALGLPGGLSVAGAGLRHSAGATTGQRERHALADGLVRQARLRLAPGRKRAGTPTAASPPQETQ